VLGGPLTPYASKKWMRALEIARDNRILYVSFRSFESSIIS
jgi:hypothetical protein